MECDAATRASPGSGLGGISRQVEQSLAKQTLVPGDFGELAGLKDYLSAFMARRLRASTPRFQAHQATWKLTSRLSLRTLRIRRGLGELASCSSAGSRAQL